MPSKGSHGCHVLACLGWLLAAVGILFGAGGAGCFPATAEPVDGNAPGGALKPTPAGEPNDTFRQAIEVLFNSAGQAQLQGTIAFQEDVDVYYLGALAAGDRIIIDVSTPDSSLDASVAIFDDQERLAFENDDRSYELNQFDPFLNAVVRHDSSNYYLAIASAPLAPSRGAYEVLITVVRGSEAPPPVPQIVALDFDGGTVTIPQDDTYTVGPFDTGDISSAYAGMTAEVRGRIAETIRENYQGLALDVRVIPGDTLLADGRHSTVYFGGGDASAFGISEAIDPYNADLGDNSIIFTETFTPSMFGRNLTAAELGTAIGNVASHEVGHLLGLNHVAHEYDLMDTTGGADALLFDQKFMTSPLDDTIWPFGWQDGVLLLLETIGRLPP